MRHAHVPRRYLPARFAPAIAAATATAAAGASTTTAAPAAEPIPATATAESAATLARFARTSFVDGKSAAAHIGAVQSCHGFICLGIVRHLDKCETTGLSRVAVFYDLYPIHLSVCGERGIKILLGSLERNVPDVNVLQKLTPSLVAAGREQKFRLLPDRLISTRANLGLTNGINGAKSAVTSAAFGRHFILARFRACE